MKRKFIIMRIKEQNAYMLGVLASDRTSERKIELYNSAHDIKNYFIEKLKNLDAQDHCNI